MREYWDVVFAGVVLGMPWLLMGIGKLLIWFGG